MIKNSQYRVNTECESGKNRVKVRNRKKSTMLQLSSNSLLTIIAKLMLNKVPDKENA